MLRDVQKLLAKHRPLLRRPKCFYNRQQTSRWTFTIVMLKASTSSELKIASVSHALVLYGISSSTSACLPAAAVSSGPLFIEPFKDPDMQGRQGVIL